MSATVLLCGNLFDGVSDITLADDPALVRALVRREHTYGSDWIKTTNTGGYFSSGDDPARVTWFDDEMEALTSTAHQLRMPVAVHTGAPEGCKQAIRCGARSLEDAYLVDSEGLAMAAQSGVFVVPTMQMTQEDLHQLQEGTLPCQAVWKFRRDNEKILAAQRLLAATDVKIAYGTVSRWVSMTGLSRLRCHRLTSPSLLALATFRPTMWRRRGWTEPTPPERGGARTSMQGRGISFSAHFVTESATNPFGGFRQTARYTPQIDFGVDLDLSRLAGDPGGNIQILLLDRRTQPFCRCDSKSVRGSGTLPRRPGFSACRVQLRAKRLSNKLSFHLGWAPAGNYFASLPVFCDFQNGFVCHQCARDSYHNQQRCSQLFMEYLETT